MPLLKNDLVEIMQSLKPTGFEIEYYKGSIYLVEDESSIRKIIIITFLENFPHSITFTGVHFSITYNIVEDILMRQSVLLGLEYSPSSSFVYSDFNLSCEHTLIDKIIETQKDLLTMKPLFKDIITNTARPFFEEYQDLNQVAEFFSRLTPQEVVPYIRRAKLFCKTILILRETKHTSFEEKRNEFYRVLQKQASKKEVYRQQLKLFESLFFDNAV